MIPLDLVWTVAMKTQTPPHQDVDLSSRVCAELLVCVCARARALMEPGKATLPILVTHALQVK